LATLRVLKQCVPPPTEIIVHVDGNEIVSRDILAAEHPDIRFLLSEENIGPGGGRNKLVKSASQTFVASFDDDSYPVDQDFFARTIYLFNQHPEASIITGRVFHRGEQISDADTSLEWTSDFSGGGCVFRRDDILSTSGYVPLPTAYGMEEVDLALRLHADGKRILRTGWLRIYHDTDLKRHADPEVTAGSISNIFLLTYLRYPVTLWPIGMAQAARRILWLLTHGRQRGVASGLLRTIPTLRRNIHHVQRLSRQAVKSYLTLRRNPRPFAWSGAKSPSVLSE
jgi:GT2 family glycosyltransferase